MIVFVTAIFSEAKALIEYFDLQKVEKKPFLIYQSDNIALIISGIGKVNSAIATTYISQKYSIDKMINIGICGTNDTKKEIGSLCSIKSIVDASSSKKIVISNDGETLYTFDKIIEDKNSVKKGALVDMEAFGFYSAASKFVDKKDIKIYKIISDHLETSHIDNDFIYHLIKNRLEDIKDLV